MRKHIVATAIALSLAAAGSVAYAQTASGDAPAYGPGYGRGAGPGFGAGMMRGYGGGPGSGPGMMMRGAGARFGPGAAAALPDLSNDQRDSIAKIQEETRRRNWDTMGQMRSEQFKLRQLFGSASIDATAVAEQQKKVDELRRVVLASRVEAHNQVSAVLTPAQRQQFRAGPNR